jgi:hypothetical protein
LPSAPVAETPDPVIALAERFLEADRESAAAFIAVDESEPMQQWRKKNPEPIRGKAPAAPNIALSLNNGWIDIGTGAPVTSDEAFPNDRVVEQQHLEALRKWKRRRQAAERRTGYRKLWQANEEARQRFFEAQAALSDAIPLTWTGLAAKARAFRKTYGDSEHNLMRALMLDIAVLSGQLDRGSARPEGDEDYANA